MILDPNKDAISYASPLAEIIMGARVNEIREGQIAGRKKRFRILKIEIEK